MEGPEVGEAAGGGTAGVDVDLVDGVAGGAVVAAGEGEGLGGVGGREEGPGAGGGVEFPDGAGLLNGGHGFAAAAGEDVDLAVKGR